jgi:hypothetical protein
MKHTTTNPRIFIFCVGEIAEPNYFQDFKNFLRSRTILIKEKLRFQKSSPWEFINKVIIEKKRLIKRREFSEEDSDQCWCVFDVDDYWSQNQTEFKKSIAKAEKNKISLAWSNECFELWYLLHFQELNSTINRAEYDKKLKVHFRKAFGIEYTKGDRVFNKILPLQPKAIRNAEKIFRDGKIDRNPATAVFKLVQELKNNFS